MHKSLCNSTFHVPHVSKLCPDVESSCADVKTYIAIIWNIVHITECARLVDTQ